MKSILLVGVGGQGTILASKILVAGLVLNGYDVKMSEIHGMSQRGGVVSTHIRFGRDPIHSPIISLRTADMIVAFEKMEALRALDYLRPEGCVLTSDQEVLTSSMRTGSAVYPKDVTRTLCAAADTIELPVSSLAASLGSEKAANLIILGAAIELLDLRSINWSDVIRSTVKKEFVALNLSALELGRRQVSRL